jgi:nucleoside 2-deoxyribosyltransferase
VKLYLAGPLFTFGDIEQNLQLAEELREFGYECFLPQEQETNVRPVSAEAIFNTDVAGVDWCDVIVACMDGPDPDSGTCWELGYGHAKGKPSVLYRTDFRSACGDFDGTPFNLMMAVPAKSYVQYRGKRMRELAVLLHDALRRLAPC